MNPQKCGGLPCVRGMRIRVKDVLELLGSGMTVEDIVLPPAAEEDLERVLRRIARQRGFSLASHRLDLVGDCINCDERPA